jgi:hypothetical protein
VNKSAAGIVRPSFGIRIGLDAEERMKCPPFRPLPRGRPNR